MRTFQDNKGRTWEIDVTVASIARLRAHELGINLYEAGVPKKAEGLYQRLSDPETLVRVLYVLCEPQFEKQFGAGKSAAEYGNEFGEGLAGDVLDAASEAIDMALVDFFPKARRQTLEAATGKIREIERRTTERQIATLNHPKVEEMVTRALDKAQNEALNELEKRLTS